MFSSLFAILKVLISQLIDRRGPWMLIFTTLVASVAGFILYILLLQQPRLHERSLSRMSSLCHQGMLFDIEFDNGKKQNLLFIL